MSSVPHISLEQWRSLMAVVDAGGYAQAAAALHKSQSAVTYAVQKIESQLGVKVFAIEGRKAALTPTGQMLYRRAVALVGEARDLERAAQRLSAACRRGRWSRRRGCRAPWSGQDGARGSCGPPASR